MNALATEKRFQNRIGEGDGAIYPLGLGKIGTVPGGFETASNNHNGTTGMTIKNPATLQWSFVVFVVSSG
jgi:hypothetical protein